MWTFILLHASFAIILYIYGHFYERNIVHGHRNQGSKHEILNVSTNSQCEAHISEKILHQTDTQMVKDELRYLILQTFLRLVFENKILLIITGLGSNYIEATILRTCIVVQKTREMLCSSVKYPPKFLAVNLSLGRHISSLYIRGSKSGLSIPGAKERGERGSVVLDLGVSSASSTRTIKKSSVLNIR